MNEERPEELPDPLWKRRVQRGHSLCQGEELVFESIVEGFCIGVLTVVLVELRSRNDLCVAYFTDQ